MKIAVTGADGFLGKALMRSLLADDAGHEVIRITRSAGYDILDLGWQDAAPDFDVLVHLAAKSFVPDSYRSPHAFYTTNVTGTLNMLELCRKAGRPLVFMSSYVYGHPQYLPIDEQHPLAAANPYGETKIMGEALCRAYARDFGVPSVALRLFNLYGPGQSSDFLLSKILTQVRSDGRATLMDPRPRRDFVYLDDVVDCMKQVVLRPFSQGFEAFNIGGGRSYSMQDVVSVIRGFYPEAIISFTGEQRPNEILDTVSNIGKAREQLGWAPLFDLERGIRAILDHTEQQR